MGVGPGSYNRRKFLGKSLSFSVATTMGANILLTACEEKDGENKVNPTEDLMQEHGVLNRILLIYEHCKIQLLNKKECNPELINSAARIVRTFIEDYHGKQEENYLFPRFEKAGQLIDLVSTLKIQHLSGREITEQILLLSKAGSLSESDNQKLINLLSDFSRMFRPHEAREDTVLFPAFRKIVSKHEFDSIGEEFEKNEHKLFGEDGFEIIISKVENIEKALGIYDLSLYTPK